MFFVEIHFQKQGTSIHGLFTLSDAVNFVASKVTASPGLEVAKVIAKDLIADQKEPPFTIKASSDRECFFFSSLGSCRSRHLRCKHLL